MAAIVGLHVVNLYSAGPLWRDEIGDVVYASMRTWGEIWAKLKYDNFPPGLLVVLRAWQRLGWAGPGAETGYRAGGLLVGLALLAGFWINARLLGGRAPFFSLGLFAACGLVVRVGDSVRPYGLGWLGGLLTFGLLGRVAAAERPGRRVVLPAALAAVLGVQCLYQNAFLLLASGTAGMIVAARAGRWRSVAVVAGIGALAAVSLLPYALGPVRASAEWSMVSRTGTGWRHLLWLGWSGIAASSAALPWMWIAAIGLAAAVFARAWRTGSGDEPPERAAWLYAGLATGIVMPLYLAFLKGLGMAGSTWYLLAPLVVAASALDGLGGACRRWPRWRWVPAVFLVTTVALGLGGARYEVGMRATNADVVAALVEQGAGPDDLVIVSPWWNGVSFRYYYHGTARWESVPPLEDHTIHRYDLMKQRIAAPEGNAPQLAQLGETLRAGHRVWAVGWFRELPVPGQELPVLKPAPDPNAGWNEAAYEALWGAQVHRFLKEHAVRTVAVPVPMPGGQQVNLSETIELGVAEGWQP